jgi:4'-phosphopantetheinyl transferase
VVRWLSQGMDDAPAHDDWLSPVERGYVARLRFPKRRSEFRLGRWTAKAAIARQLGLELSIDELRRIVIERAPDGAPAPFLGGRPADVYISMTDRADQAVCLAGPPGTALGCDLELVEPRSDGFVADYLTPAEQELVAAARGGDARSLAANLVWCGKESALKVLRTGLRRDTRSVSVAFPPGATIDGWAPMIVRSHEGAAFPGWWQRFGSFVLTVAATQPFDPPRSFVDPPGLASAVPAESWRRQLPRR